MKNIYGLVGFPLGHSFSRKYFAEKFSREGIEAEYLNFELSSIDLIKDIIEKNENLKGFNVTIPYKQEIISNLDSMSRDAEVIGAVNVVKVTRANGIVSLRGYNADVIGFTESIRPLLKPEHKKAMILGTGGASKAVRFGLESLGIETLYVSRTKREGAITYDDITAETLREYPVIVNCSPVGMFPHTEEAPALPYPHLTKNNLLYDLVYNPLETLFLKKGQEQGAITKNGLEMLHLQAEASWKFWEEK